MAYGLRVLGPIGQAPSGVGPVFRPEPPPGRGRRGVPSLRSEVSGSAARWSSVSSYPHSVVLRTNANDATRCQGGAGVVVGEQSESFSI